MSPRHLIVAVLLSVGLLVLAVAHRRYTFEIDLDQELLDVDPGEVDA